MLPATVSQGNEVYFWNTMPRSLPGPFTGCSFTRTSPESGRSSPAIKRSRVDLPHPEGPRSTRNSPMSLPSRENASSISKLMFCRASILSRLGPAKDRLTFLTVIFDFLGAMLCRLQVCGCTRHRGAASGKSRGCFAPGEQPRFQECQKETEKERSNTDGDDAGIDPFEIQHLARRLNHVTHAFAGVHHLGQDHVSPAD